MNTREGFVCSLPRLFCSGFEDIVNRGDVLFPFCAAFADWVKGFLEHVDEELLAGSVTETSAAVMLLHLVEVLVVGQILGKVVVGAEGVEVGEHHVALGVAGILDSQVSRIGEHLAVDLLFDGLGGVGKINAVAERLAHLRLAVYAGQTALGFVFGDNRLGQNKGFAVEAVKLLDNLTCLLNHR